jgi:hypothetical protein
MFEITDETRNADIEAMREIIRQDHLTDETIGEAFDAAVAIVKKQFGM